MVGDREIKDYGAPTSLRPPTCLRRSEAPASRRQERASRRREARGVLIPLSPYVPTSPFICFPPRLLCVLGVYACFGVAE